MYCPFEIFELFFERVATFGFSDASNRQKDEKNRLAQVERIKTKVNRLTLKKLNIMSPITLLTTAALVCASVNTNAATVNTKAATTHTKATSVNTITASVNTSHLRYRNNYDNRGRVTTRTSYFWDGNQWQPALRWAYHYSVTGYTIELSRWNTESDDFEAPISKTIYAFTPGQTAAFVTTYTRTDENAEYQLQDSLLAAFPDASLLDCIASTK